MIRLTIPSLDESDFRAVREVLESGYLVQGPRVAEFEHLVAQRAGVEYAIAVANCTSALHLTLLSLGVGPGDNVAVATYSWPATANTIVLCGATPLFVDIDPVTYNMDPEALQRTLGSSPAKVVLVVHAFGGMAEMRRIAALAADYSAVVVEDAACALGATLDSRPAGSWGTAGCFSFHPRKAVTTGEGGVVSTDDPALARSIRILRNHGLDPEVSVPDFVAAGFNLRMTEFQAALGTTQLAKLDRIIAARSKCAARYNRLLQGTGVTPPGKLDGSVHVYQSYVALLPAASATQRAAIIHRLREAGIETTIGTYHVPLTSYFRANGSYTPGMFPVTDEIASCAISLPLYETLTEGEQDMVVEKLLAVISN